MRERGEGFAVDWPGSSAGETKTQVPTTTRQKGSGSTEGGRERIIKKNH